MAWGIWLLEQSKEKERELVSFECLTFWTIRWSPGVPKIWHWLNLSNAKHFSVSMSIFQVFERIWIQWTEGSLSACLCPFIVCESTKGAKGGSTPFWPFGGTLPQFLLLRTSLQFSVHSFVMKLLSAQARVPTLHQIMNYPLHANGKTRRAHDKCTTAFQAYKQWGTFFDYF